MGASNVVMWERSPCRLWFQYLEICSNALTDGCSYHVLTIQKKGSHLRWDIGKILSWQTKRTWFKSIFHKRYLSLYFYRNNARSAVIKYLFNSIKTCGLVYLAATRGHTTPDIFIASLHYPNDKYLPAFRTVQGACQWSLKTVEIPYRSNELTNIVLRLSQS